MATRFPTPAAAIDHVINGPNYRLTVADTQRPWSSSRKRTHATLEDAFAFIAERGTIYGVQVSRYGADNGIIVDAFDAEDNDVGSTLYPA